MHFSANDALIFQGIINQNEQDILLKWSENQLETGTLLRNIIGHNRFFGRIDYLTNIPHEFWQVRERLIKALGLKEVMEEPIYKNYVGCNLEGAQIGAHRDIAPFGMVHLRCNLMVSKPLVGGHPVINDIELDLKTGDAWAFYPSEKVHWSTEVKQHVKRFICSYGFLVNRNQIPLEISESFLSSTRLIHV